MLQIKRESSFLRKLIHRWGLVACVHYEEVTLSPYFLYASVAETREDSRKKTLKGKYDKKSKTTGKQE